MTKTTFVATIAIGILLAASTAHAVDPAAGQKQYDATCAACHGPQGISIAPIYPNLAGQKDEYLVTQLKAFRDGTRKNPIMEPMAKGLTDTDIVNIAAYVSTLKP